MTSRSSSCAARALMRMTAAAWAISSGGRRRVELQRSGVNAQQRDAVGEHVVHLARDPGALGLAGLAHPEILLVLQPARPLVQREEELAAGVDIEAIADGDRGGDEADLERPAA